MRLNTRTIKLMRVVSVKVSRDLVTTVPSCVQHFDLQTGSADVGGSSSAVSLASGSGILLEALERKMSSLFMQKSEGQCFSSSKKFYQPH